MEKCGEMHLALFVWHRAYPGARESRRSARIGSL